ncbi:MAG: rhodanese-like domain-containing protein [Planctomycetes bacterium]|nr:rhodanese-like domain-containing protein [Planctomycetota bacterium]
MAVAIRFIACLLVVISFAACSGKVRHDFGGGGSDADVQILRDCPAVELSIWDGAVVFDLRDYDQWTQGHISGARQITLQDLERGRGLPDDKDAPVLFMADGPMDTRAEQAADIALKRGHNDVQLFPGGWRMWIGAHPVGE